MRYVGTRNPRSVHNPLRSLPLFRPAATVFGPSATDHLIGDLRHAMSLRAGWARQYDAARAKLGWANRTMLRWRRDNQRDAMRDLNRVRAAMRANLRKIESLRAQLISMGISPATWACAEAD